MIESTLPSLSSLSPDEALLVDKLCTRFEDAWQRGERPRLEDYRTEVPEAVWPVLFRGLRAWDVESGSRAGERPTLEEYAQRFSPRELRIASLLVDPLTVADSAGTQTHAPAAPPATPVSPPPRPANAP